MAEWSTSTTRITIDGKTYSGVEEMPPEVRDKYQKAIEVLADRDGNGVPDILEGKNPPGMQISKGVQRYGFHGLSYEYLMTQPSMNGRVILAHLGNGASLAAVRDGQPVDTSMAFTPAAGLPMSKTCAAMPAVSRSNFPGRRSWRWALCWPSLLASLHMRFDSESLAIRIPNPIEFWIGECDASVITC